MKLSRRDFLKSAGIVTAGLTVGGFAKPLFGAVPTSNIAALANRVVVIVNLQGGNDGLNTVIPLNQYDRYAELRPLVKFDQSELLSLSGQTDFALNPGLTKIRDLYNSGKVAILNGVGVPHDATGLFDHDAGQYEFQSCDVVRNGTSAPTGWLGRYLDAFTANAVTPGIDIGGGTLILRGTSHDPMTINSIDDLRLYLNFEEDARKAAYQSIMNLPNSNSVADYNRLVRKNAMEQADIIINATESYVPAVQYPDSYLAFSLQQCAKIISASLGVKALTVGLGGFDTHSGQNSGAYHAGLMQDFSDSVNAFYADLVAHSLQDRVLILTISEFGRRPYDNNDAGTDHGYSSTAFAIGDMVNGGVYGTYPDLSDQWLVFDGNMDVTTDFRRVYSTIAANFFQVDPVPIVGGSFPTLSFV